MENGLFGFLDKRTLRRHVLLSRLFTSFPRITKLVHEHLPASSRHKIPPISYHRLPGFDPLEFHDLPSRSHHKQAQK